MPEIDKPSPPPLVLIANDQEWSARSLESILGPRGYAVLRAYTGRQALELAKSAEPDLVILDFRLPDLDGVDVCRSLREDARFSATTPIIMTTAGAPSRAQRIAVYQAGAWEFCPHPLDGELLLAKLNTFMACKSEIDRVRGESLLDESTGLYNMRGLARRARELGAEALRTRGALACIAFAPDVSLPEQTDQVLNGFAEHLAKHVGELFRRTGRTSDAIGRLGHSEFAIIAPSTEAAGAVRLVERVREFIEKNPISLRGEERPMKLRAGYYAVSDFGESALDPVEMLLRAAAALRHTRAEGGHRHVISFEEVPARVP